MPHSLRILKELRAANFADDQSMGIASVMATARCDENSVFVEDEVLDTLCAHGFAEGTAAAIASVLRYCFGSNRFSHYSPSTEKTQLVRAGVTALKADAFLTAVDSCVISARGGEVRLPLRYTPSPGHVVMCDFTFLRKPEMQKIRRAIVISPRSTFSNNRCTLIPVSKKPSQPPNPIHRLFPAGAYQFFHPSEPVWAVCDHIYTVALTRIWQVNVRRRPILPSISADDLAAVKSLVGSSLGL